MRRPTGCFEQTSATTYPLTLAHQAIMRSPQHSSAELERSRAYLQQGYDRLLGFACRDGGFEWFGRGEGHVGLSAFGLVMFDDLKRIGIASDPTLITRLQQWLRLHIGAQGQVLPTSNRGHHHWDVAGPILDTYVFWALAHTNSQPPAIMTARVADHLHTIGDQHAWLRLVAGQGFAALGDTKQATALLNSIRSDEHGRIQDIGNGSLHSNTNSIAVEAAARAILLALELGWTRDRVEAWVSFINRHERLGRFGTTQATALALAALHAIEQRYPSQSLRGHLTLIDARDQQIIRRWPVDDTAPRSVALNLDRSDLDHLIIRWDGSPDLPWQAVVRGQLLHPISMTDPPLEMHLGPLPDTIRLGDPVDLELVITATDSIATPIACIGLSAGIQIRADRLDELVEAGQIAAWEIHGPHVVLYFRHLDPGIHRLRLAAIADIPGTFLGQAGYIQPYYNDEQRFWSPPLQVHIAP